MMSMTKVGFLMGLLALSSLSTFLRAPSIVRATGGIGKEVSRRTCSELGISTVVAAERSRQNVAQVCAVDLLALFGGHDAASAVEESRAKELLGCVRILAPDSISTPSFHVNSGEAFFREAGVGCDEECLRVQQDVKKLIASPPAAVEELARSTVEWGGDPNVVLNALGPMKYLVPEVEGSIEEHCTLTKYDDGQRFAKTAITEYMGFLFEAIAKLAPTVGLNISLSRFDLFHGHMFTAQNTGRLGILFHSREYPAYDAKKFAYNLGYCQRGSPLPYDESMALRNIVWLAPMPDCSCDLNLPGRTCSKKWLAPGALFVLDTGGGQILDRELVPDYLDVVHTVSEDDLGEVMLDVNYFNFVNESLENRVYLC